LFENDDIRKYKRNNDEFVILKSNSITDALLTIKNCLKRKKFSWDLKFFEIVLFYEIKKT